MDKPTIIIKKKLMFILSFFVIFIIFLICRLFYLQYFKGEKYQAKAYEQQTRDRLIAPKRGVIYDRNMTPIAINETVCSVSVINAQIKDKEQVSKVLAEKLEIDYNTVLKKVSKKVALERIKTKVNKTLADEIRKLDLKGVVIDEDIKRIYPFNNMASQVVGFVGKDNQGIIGIEAKYDKYLKGESGKILTETDSRGMEFSNSTVKRIEPKNGDDLVITIDANLQQYIEQALNKALIAKNAQRGAIVMMNPKNGEIIAMANKPDFDLNKPFEINKDDIILDNLNETEKNKLLNQMWRNFSINDTYEPGSTFKIITTAAAFEEGLYDLDSEFDCNGYVTVGGITIKCWRYPRNHGHQNFLQGIQNSCNPVFIDMGEKLGAETFYKYLDKFGFRQKTGIDLPGEAVGIMHKLDKVGSVELATMSFGQSFQITPLQLLRGVSATINGGYLVTPHVGQKLIDEDGNIEELLYDVKGPVISQKVSDDLKYSLETVVSAGTGNKTYIPGYKVGGKTATSEKLPRRSGKYIASFLTFAPADDPNIITLVLIDEPQGIYYGGQVAGPIMKEVLDNSMPYLNITQSYTEDEKEKLGLFEMPSYINMPINAVIKELEKLGFKVDVIGEGEKILKQFPLESEEINIGSTIILYLE